MQRVALMRAVRLIQLSDQPVGVFVTLNSKLGDTFSDFRLRLWETGHPAYIDYCDRPDWEAAGVFDRRGITYEWLAENVVATLVELRKTAH